MFDNIRPLNDNEIPEAMAGIAASPLMPAIAQFVYPGQDPSVFAERLRATGTAKELQVGIMKDAMERIIANSIASLTTDGLDALDPNRPCLFISNHRDITLDAMLLYYLLYKQSPDNFQTLYITFGANLMQDPTVTLIGRANHMFRVERGGTPKEFYSNMLLTSSYIHHVITQLHHSVWIAQRNGRTKNGLDRTEPALLKMLALAGRATKADPLQPLKKLNIVPVSVSYEWEPCDLLKARELHLRSLGPYRKQKGEDLNSVLTGIMQPKGCVHISATKPLSDDEIDQCSTTDTPFENLAALIDRRIITNYRIHDTNRIAMQLFRQPDGALPHPDSDTARKFIERLPDEAAERQILLGIYANPLFQQMLANE